ncbi:reverse transcriptase domain-containing protein [Tanacetum coccineum]|uniref:Reverse transcriptase domain-containing protein n=1 Tax=Tanacetum coccineum TaxID=301880 RepID=A0ABQ5J0I3_9ASTR
MHTRASNSELVKPLAEPERTLNRRLRRRNRRVPFERRNERPEQPRVIYPPILDINHFCHFLILLENFNPMDDEPMWDVAVCQTMLSAPLLISRAANHVVAPTPSSAITILETANEFAIKGNHLTLIKGNQFDGRIKTDLHKHIHEFLAMCDMFKYKETKNEAVCLMRFPLSLTGEAKTWLDELNEGTKNPEMNFKTLAFADEGSSNSDTNKIMARMDAITMKMDAQYKEIQSRAKCNHCRGNHSTADCNDDDTPINKHKLEQISSAFLSDESSAIIQNKVPPKLRDPGSFLIPCTFGKTFSFNALADLRTSNNLMLYSLHVQISLETLKPTKMSVRLADRSFQYPIGIAKNMLVEVDKFTFPMDFVILEMEEDSKVSLILGRIFLHTADAVIRVKQKQLNLGVGTQRMTFSINSAMKQSYSNDDTCFSIDIIDEILKEDFDALLDEGSKILYSIEGTLLEDQIFAKFDEFMAMNIKENS